MWDGGQMDFAELHTQANRLAHYLRDKGVGPDVCVAIAAERSPQLLIGLLAIIKAGGAYVPLDPDYPAERLAYMLSDSGVELLLTPNPIARALAGQRWRQRDRHGHACTWTAGRAMRRGCTCTATTSPT